MVRNLRRLFRQARPYWHLIIIGILAAVGVSAAATAVPWIVRRVIDDAIGESDWNLLLALIGALLGVGLFRAVCFGTRRQLAGRTSIYVEADLRELLYEHAQALDMGYHERVSTGQIMSRASSDLQAIRQYLTTVPWSFTLMAQIVFVLAAMLLLDWPLALVTFLLLPFLAIAAYRFSQAFDPVIWRMQQKLADLASVVEETVTGIRVVKGFGRERHQSARLSTEASQIFDAAVESIRLRASFLPFFNLLPQLAIVVVLWFGGRRVISGDITLGTLVAFNAYLALLVWPLRAMGNIVTTAQRSATAVGRVFEVLDTPPGVADRPGATPLRIDRGEIRFSSVRFNYPGGKQVLDGVDLRVPAGSALALVGPTGCGKSTLVRMVARFVEPVAGTLTIDGRDISEVTLVSLRDEIGMVFEDTFLFSDTIANNIAFGRPDASMDEIVRAAVIAQAHGFVSDLPDGYDTMVGEQGFTLSGGQRQRIAIARAIVMNPRILILDDATSSVDPRMEAEIRRGLAEAMHRRTTLIVARRPSTASLADTVALMEAGRIVATGTHEELWTTVPAYRDALTAQSTIEQAADAVGEQAS